MGEAVTYEGGKTLQAGDVSTDQIPLGADTYYPGMLLEYQADGTATADGSNTGNGTVTDVVAGAGVKSGDWVLTMTAALVAKLVDPDGNLVASNIALTDGGAVTLDIAGISMTITDGSTAFAAADFFTVAIEAAGEYVALDHGDLGAIYNGEERILSSSGAGYAIMAGEINETGLVDSSGVSITITEDQRAKYRDNGFVIKRV